MFIHPSTLCKIYDKYFVTQSTIKFFKECPTIVTFYKKYDKSIKLSFKEYQAIVCPIL